MVVINTGTAVAIASIVVALVIYLINKLLSYERRITKLEVKLENWDPYFEIVTKGMIDHFRSSVRNRIRRGVKR